MFDNRFEVFLADNPLGKTLHYRLRHQVYCEERGWESSAEGVTGLEYDKYDDKSAHFLVRSRHSGYWVGGMRLVWSPFHELPIHARCEIASEYCDVHAQRQSAELSRLFIVSDFRNGQYLRPYAMRRDMVAKCGSVAGSEGHALQNEIILGLIRAARDFSQLQGISAWYFLVARSLARKLTGMGLGLQSCGQEIKFHGARRPYYGDLNTFFDGLRERSVEAAQMFADWGGFRLFSELDVPGDASMVALPAPAEAAHSQNWDGTVVDTSRLPS